MAISDALLPLVAELSIRGRLAIALHCFESACDAHGLATHPEIRTFLAHMWRLLGPDTGPFPEWEKASPPLVHVGLGCDFPDGFVSFLQSRGVSEDDFRRLLSSTVEVVYSNAYGAADQSETLVHLEGAVRSAEKLGGRCPDPRRFAGSRWADCHGWGKKLSAEELATWRPPGAMP
jgi:hypothetical protein